MIEDISQRGFQSEFLQSQHSGEIGEHDIHVSGGLQLVVVIRNGIREIHSPDGSGQ
jgi:hypothetical protein